MILVILEGKRLEWARNNGRFRCDFCGKLRVTGSRKINCALPADITALDRTRLLRVVIVWSNIKLRLLSEIRVQTRLKRVVLYLLCVEGRILFLQNLREGRVIDILLKSTLFRHERACDLFLINLLLLLSRRIKIVLQLPL